jgi:hypothetical protein
MSVPAPQVVPLFAIPFGVVTVPEADVLNRELVPLFNARAATAAPDAVVRRTPTAFQGRDDLLDWPDAPVRALLGAMIGGVSAVAASINQISGEQFASLRVEARAWYSIVRPDGCLPSTQYPNTSWLAMYCAAAPAASPTRFDSGVLRLHESRLGTMFPDATNCDTVMPYRPGHSAWRPVPGQMAVFPAWITHEVALVRSVGDLVLVTARVRYVGPEQAGMRWW